MRTRWRVCARTWAAALPTARPRLGAMMTPQQQRKIVIVIAVVVGISMVLSLVLPFLGL